MDEYIKLPFPITTSWIPFNYCVIPKLSDKLKFLKHILKYFCH